MSKKDVLKRRDFLKMSAGAAAAGVIASNFENVFSAPKAGWTKGMAINPNISNMLVVGCYDKTMVKSNPSSRNFATVTAAVDTVKVQANLDGMAERLSGKKTTAEAWAAIFNKPADKNWSDVKVAIKVNIIATTILANVAVIGKVCKELANLGVAPKNIIIYDGNSTYASDANRNAQYPPYFSLTDATKIAAVISEPNSKALGGTTQVTLKGLGPTFETYNANCTKYIADGTIDILVNISVNKGHGTGGNGNFTLSMKNHYGTFDPKRHDDGTRDYIFGINASEPILGGTPPRQQLCIVDSLWAESVGNDGPPDRDPYYWLVMGTFGPAVDYLTIKKIREPVMKAKHNGTVVDAILPAFGYAVSDLNWVLYDPTGVEHSISQESTPSVQITLSNGPFKQSSAHFSLPRDIGGVRVNVFDLKGRKVRELESPSLAGKAAAIVWDGRATNGNLVSDGEYVVRATAGSFSQAGRLLVSRL